MAGFVTIGIVAAFGEALRCAVVNRISTMQSSLRRGAAALALASLGFLAAPAQAASVTITGWAFGAGNEVATTLYSGLAGGFVGTLSDAGAFDTSPFTTYCVELGEYFGFGTTPMAGYEIVSGASYFGAAKSDQIGRLMSWAKQHPNAVDTAAESTSLQLAIWNTIYDNDQSLTAAGAFRDVSAYRGVANSLLGSAQTVQNGYDVFVLRRSGTQDFLLVREAATSVPEPASLALVALALGAAAGVRRRPKA
jgi:hypothetical protein